MQITHILVENRQVKFIGQMGREVGSKRIWETTNNKSYRIGSQDRLFSGEGRYTKDGNKQTVFDVSGDGVVQPSNVDGLYT